MIMSSSSVNPANNDIFSISLLGTMASSLT
jgi:hypothetical protein